MNVKLLAKEDRPREKMLARGEQALSDLELLQVVIGSGVHGADVTQISKEILKLLEAQNGKIKLEQLLKIKGVSTATATKLLAGLELTSRFVKTGMKIQNSTDVLPLVADLRTKKQEHFVVLTLDGANRLIERRTVSIGTLSASLVHPREVFADAIADRAASIIVVHNHPGGSLEPSNADIEVTKRLREVGTLVGIKLLDHIIITHVDHIIVS